MNKSRLILPFLIGALFILSSCNDDTSGLPVDTTTTVNVVFQPLFNGVPFAAGDVYDYEDMEIKFQNFNFYVSDFSLVNDEGEQELFEIEFVNLRDQPTFSVEIQNVPVGDYTGVQFGLGLNPEINQTTPSDYADTHPLGINNSAMYWQGWESYIFAKIEGRADTLGTGEFTHPFSFHMGADISFREVTAFNPISLEEDVAKTLEVTVDLRKILAPNIGTALDIKEFHEAHVEGDLNVSEFIMDNFESSFDAN